MKLNFYRNGDDDSFQATHERGPASLCREGLLRLCLVRARTDSFELKVKTYPCWNYNEAELNGSFVSLLRAYVNGEDAEVQVPVETAELLSRFLGSSRTKFYFKTKRQRPSL